MKSGYKAILFCLVIGFFLCSSAANAQPLRTRLDLDTLNKGCSFSFNDNKFNLGIPPETMSNKAKLTIKKIIWPKELNKKISPVYSYDLRNHREINLEKPLWLTIKVKKSKTENKIVKLKYWDSNLEEWKAIPSSYDAENGIVQAAVHLPYAQVAVFVKNKKKYKYQTGIASWYDWHGAASNDYPMGTKLKVTNLDNGESVVVKVVSRGPFNHYIIDLPRDAFDKLADLGTGLINVKVRPL